REIAAVAPGQLAQLGEEIEDSLHGPLERVPGVRIAPRVAWSRCGVAPFTGDVQVLPDREVGEDAPVFGDEADAGLGDSVRRPAGDVDGLPRDAARLRRREAH